MQLPLVIAAAFLALGLAGCGAPNPPGWPSGEPRPINPQQQQVKAAR